VVENPYFFQIGGISFDLSHKRGRSEYFKALPFRLPVPLQTQKGGGTQGCRRSEDERLFTIYGKPNGGFRADEGKRILLPQIGDTFRRDGIAGDDDRLYGKGGKVIRYPFGEGVDLLFRPIAVRGVFIVSVITKVFIRQKAGTLGKQSHAADTAVVYADTVIFFHKTLRKKYKEK
jgi:hypothetical protein